MTVDWSNQTTILKYWHASTCHVVGFIAILTTHHEFITRIRSFRKFTLEIWQVRVEHCVRRTRFYRNPFSLQAVQIQVDKISGVGGRHSLCFVSGDESRACRMIMSVRQTRNTFTGMIPIGAHCGMADKHNTNQCSVLSCLITCVALLILFLHGSAWCAVIVMQLLFGAPTRSCLGCSARTSKKTFRSTHSKHSFCLKNRASESAGETGEKQV